MIDITRLSELHTMATALRLLADQITAPDDVPEACLRDAARMIDELSKQSARLAILEEFARRASEAQYLYDEQATLHSLADTVWWLEVETEKAGEP